MAMQAYHHAGQAVEFALKAIYIQRQNLQCLPDELKSFKGHDLKSLAARANLGNDISTLKSKNKARYANWLTVRDWNSNARFPDNRQPAKAVNGLFLAVDQKVMESGNG